MEAKKGAIDRYNMFSTSLISSTFLKAYSELGYVLDDKSRSSSYWDIDHIGMYSEELAAQHFARRRYDDLIEDCFDFMDKTHGSTPEDYVKSRFYVSYSDQALIFMKKDYASTFINYIDGRRPALLINEWLKHCCGIVQDDAGDIVTRNKGNFSLDQSVGGWDTSKFDIVPFVESDVSVPMSVILDSGYHAKIIARENLWIKYFPWWRQFALRSLTIRDDVYGTNKQYKLKNSEPMNMFTMDRIHFLVNGGCRITDGSVYDMMVGAGENVIYFYNSLFYPTLGGHLKMAGTICDEDPYTNEPMDPTLIANFFDTEDYTPSCPVTIAADDKQGLIEAYKNLEGC